MKNLEYLSYIDYLKSINFDEKLKILQEKYANKKIILFGVGSFLSAILDNYEISDYLNVIGISDKRFTENKMSAFKNFNFYTPRSLRSLNFDVVLDTSVMFEDTKSYLRKNYLVKKSVKIEKIVQFSICEKIAYVQNEDKSWIWFSVYNLEGLFFMLILEK